MIECSVLLEEWKKCRHYMAAVWAFHSMVCVRLRLWRPTQPMAKHNWSNCFTRNPPCEKFVCVERMPICLYACCYCWAKHSNLSHSTWRWRRWRKQQSLNSLSVISHPKIISHRKVIICRQIFNFLILKTIHALSCDKYQHFRVISNDWQWIFCTALKQRNKQYYITENDVILFFFLQFQMKYGQHCR